MSKLTHKLKEKFVGAAISRPHFGEISKKENGITLIALIITVIVILILTGVTLSITLGDNGLVNKAKEATTQTQIAMDRELLLSAVVGAIGEDGKVNLSAIVLPEGFTGSNGTYTSENGHTFTVSENGEILFEGSDNVIENGGEEKEEFNWESVNLDVDTNIEYIYDDGSVLIFTGDGELIIRGSSGRIIAIIDATNSDNIDETTGNLRGDVEAMEGRPLVSAVATMANETDVKVTIAGVQIQIYKKVTIDDGTVYSNKEVLKALGITNSTGTYSGTWTKIGEDENGNAKLMSTSSVTRCILGYEAPKEIGTNDLEKAIWSYKNAVNSLNTAAQEATGITGARSIKIEDVYDIIGEENVNKGTEYGKVYNYYYNTETSTVYSKYKTGDNTWSEPYNTSCSSQTFVNDNGETVIVDSAGDEVTLTHSYYSYELTDEQKEEIGILASGYYFLSLPCVECYDYEVTYRVQCINRGKIEGISIFESDDDEEDYYGGAVCAVILVPGL